MPFILKEQPYENGSRPPVQDWFDDGIPEGYVLFPEALIPSFTHAKGFVDIIVENGVVVSMTENTITKTAWENTPVAPEVRIAELKTLLSDSDYQAIKFAEGLITPTDYEPIKSQRQVWRDEINTLETGGTV